MFGNNKFSDTEKRMKREEFLKGIKYLTEQQIKDNKNSFENLMKISPIMNEYNAMTHSIYLQTNKNLPLDEQIFHRQCVEVLLREEKKQVEEALKLFDIQGKNKEE
jgi:hypothetical protein